MMKISPININQPSAGLQRITDFGNVTSNNKSEGSSIPFADVLKKGLADVNKLQFEADQNALKIATGELQDIHTAMISMNKARTALDFTIQVRNKIIEAYQEIMRMQI